MTQQTKPQTLYVATSNPGKLRDFAVAAAEVGERWLIAPLPGLAAIPAPPEQGETFSENARTKALAYAAYAPGSIVLADDSGLEVDALDGAPGVYSARYAERRSFSAPALGTDAANNAALLAALDGVSRRTARYRCVLVAVRDGAVLAEAEGSLEGELLGAPRGEQGFGYDPLFLVPSHGKTMAELDWTTRLTLSHRGRALLGLLSQPHAWR